MLDQMSADKSRSAEDRDVLHRFCRAPPRPVRFCWASVSSDLAVRPLLSEPLCYCDTILYRFEGQFIARLRPKLEGSNPHQTGRSQRAENLGS
jgi:hypothetical protein